MKGPVRDSATFAFNATAKTVTFSSPIPASQQQILAVLNITRNAWLYLPTNAAYGGTWASPVLTVTASTTGHANGDVLQILVDDGLASTAITAAALPLPTGAATAAKQPALGTAGTASSDVITVQGIANGTALPVAPNVTRSGGAIDSNTQRVTLATDGPGVAALTSIDSKTPASPATAALQTTGNTSLSSIDGKLPALTAGRVPVDIGASVEVSNDAGNPLPVSGSVSITGTAAVTGPLTDTQLRATAVPVSGTFWQATQPVSAASLPLPSGAATSAAQTTTNTSLSSIDGKLAALQSGAVPIGDNSSSLTVDGTAYGATVSFTRPANTTAYTAGDVIGTGASADAIHTLSSIGSSGGYVVVQSIELVLGISAVPSGMTSFRVHFYDSSPTAAADNSAFDLASGDRAKYLGYIDMPAPVDLGATCFTQIDYSGKLFKLASASTSLFCELQTVGGFTPAANSEAYILRVKTLEAGK
jgi:hypothetical protein